MVDHELVINQSRENVSNLPVRTVRYRIEVVLNENEPEDNPQERIKDFTDEFQRALDAGYFQVLRYDLLLFDVYSREVIHTAPANYPVAPTLKQLRQIFDNKSDCYADTNPREDAPPAMTKECFVQVVSKLLGAKCDQPGG